MRPRCGVERCPETRPRSSRRPVARARAFAAGAALLLAAGSLAACSNHGTDTARPTSSDTAERNGSDGPATPDGAFPKDRGDADGGDPGRPPHPGSTIPGPPPAADLSDVPDPTVPGLGDPRIDVHHYDVTLRADPGEEAIAGRVRITLAARTAAPLATFTLDLRGPTVRSVTVDGADAASEQRGDQIEITPTSPLTPAEPTVVEVTYGGRPDPGELMDLGLRTGLQQDDEGGWFALSQPDGTRTWVPVNDHPSDKATWRITLDTPADVVGVANGRLTSRERRGDRRAWVWDLDRPMASYLALVAIGDYDLVESEGPDGLRIASAFPSSLSADDRATFGDLEAIVERLAATYGPYPDDDLGVVVVPKELGVALETQTRPLFGTDTVGAPVVVEHELAHQWGGNSVTPATWEHLWLSEGFATFASGDVHPPFGGTRRAVVSPEAARALDEVVYHGGGTALLALRDQVGEQRFARIMRTWFDRYGGGTATTADFVTLASEVAGTDLDDWATTWLYEPQPTYTGD